MHNPAHAAAVAEIESITADYWRKAADGTQDWATGLERLPVDQVDQAAQFTNLTTARQHVANCYRITGVPLGLRHVTEQTQWAQMTHDQRVAHLTLYFTLRPLFRPDRSPTISDTLRIRANDRSMLDLHVLRRAAMPV